MTRTVSTDLSHLVDLHALTGWIDANVNSDGGEISVERLGEGHSNMTFKVTRGDQSWVLRRPPRGEIAPGTHEMDREFIIMKALHQHRTPVPVPEVVAICEDPSVLGVPFFLMEMVDHVVARACMPPILSDPDEQRRVGLHLAEILAQIHAVDWQGVGLDVLARKPEKFLERNLSKMQQLYEMVASRDLPELDECGEWLRANMPEQSGVTLTHGDYKLDNVLIAPDLPGRIAAVVDWEIATIGDPMVDLGWMLYFHVSDGDPTAWNLGAATQAPGYPSRAEMTAHYSEKSSRDITDVRYYAALAGWKIAIIMEGSYRRHLEGMADDEMFATLDRVVPALAQRSLDIIRGELEVV